MTVAVHLDMKVRISKLRGSVGHGLPMTWDAPEQGWQLPGASRFQIVRAERAGPTRPLRLLAPPIRAVLGCRRGGKYAGWAPRTREQQTVANAPVIGPTNRQTQAPRS